MDKLDGVFDQLLKHPHVKKNVRLGEIWVSWDKIAGTEFARSTRPLRVVGRRLYVEVDGAPQRHKISFAKDEILNNVRAFTGGTFVEDIIFQVGSTRPNPPADT